MVFFFSSSLRDSWIDTLHKNGKHMPILFIKLLFFMIYRCDHSDLADISEIFDLSDWSDW